MFSGGAPKIVQNDKDVALFDITFEEFKSGIIKNFDEVIDSVTDEGAVYDDLSAYELQKNRYLETLTDENCWTTTENKDGSILHVWQYEDNDTLCDEMAVSVDSNSNKVKGIMVTTYDQSLMTRTLVASYIIFGNTLNAQNIETLVNVTIYCANEYNENPLLFIGDKGIMMNEVSGTLIASFIPAKTIKDNYSSSGVCIDNDDLYRFDKVLSKNMVLSMNGIRLMSFTKYQVVKWGEFMPFCEKCGKEIKDGDRFCTRCGAEIKSLPMTSVNENRLI